MNLDPVERELLSKGKLFGGKFTVKGNIKAICNGNHKEVLQGLEDKGLIEMVAYGKFVLTDKALTKCVERVSCEDCGRRYNSVSEARSSGMRNCKHNCLSIQISEYLK